MINKMDDNQTSSLSIQDKMQPGELARPRRQDALPDSSVAWRWLPGLHLLPLCLLHLCEVTVSGDRDTSKLSLHQIMMWFPDNLLGTSGWPHRLTALFSRTLWSPQHLQSPWNSHSQPPQAPSPSPAAMSVLHKVSSSLGLWGRQLRQRVPLSRPLLGAAITILFTFTTSCVIFLFPESRFALSCSWVFRRLRIAMADGILAVRRDNVPICLDDIPVPPSKYGTLRRLKTEAELRAGEETIEVYITETSSKATKKAVDAIKPALPAKWKSSLNHLRRVCTVDMLPTEVRERLARRPSNASSVSTPLSTTSNSSGISSKKAPKKLFLLLCEANVAELSVIESLLAEAFPENQPKVYTISVPKCAPVSPTQATRLSGIYWPTLYKNTNPYGAHPAEQARRESEIMENDGVHRWISLAERVAAQGSNNKLGLPIGVVVIERSEEFGTRVVAVASDARWCGLRDANDCSETGNVMGHAVMRAIGMVAQKRRVIDGKQSGRFPGKRGSETVSNETENATSENPSTVKHSLPPPEVVERDLQLLSQLPSTTISNLETSRPTWRSKESKGSIPKSLDKFQSAISNHFTSAFLDRPLTTLESTYFAPATLQPHGYLCLGLELYCTHEPCIMCSMALLHSRFGRVVFVHEMDKTGGLKAEKAPSENFVKEQSLPRLPPNKENVPPEKKKRPRKKRPEPINTSLASTSITSIPPLMPKTDRIGYGLFWRPQLNWKFLCWQWDKNPSAPKQANSSVLTSGDEFDDLTDLQVHLEALSLIKAVDMKLHDSVHA